MRVTFGLEQYFHEQATLAEELYASGNRVAAKLIAAVALDSLAAVWEHDFAINHDNADLRLAAFVQQFAGDTDAERLAVVLFAEDLARLGPPRFASVAMRLLEERAAVSGPLKRMVFGEMPHSHQDVTWTGLIVEAPELALPSIAGLAKHYQYPALLYRLIRCGLAHGYTTGSRSSDYSSSAGDDEISYFASTMFGGTAKPISIKFGIRRITGWLRAAATNYIAACAVAGKRPADKFDASSESLARLDAKWKTLK